MVDNKKFRRGAILSMLVLVTGCAPLTEYERLHARASKSFFYGDYDACIIDLVDSLRINPGNDEARSLLARAYQRAISMQEGRIHQIKKHNGRRMWNLVAAEYHKVMRLNEVISGVLMPGFEIQDFSRELNEAIRRAAESRHQEG